MRWLPFVALLALGCRASTPSTAAPIRTFKIGGDGLLAHELLCSDIGSAKCLAACENARTPREHAECLIAYRFSADPEAHALARDLYSETHALVGIGLHRAIDGFPGEEIPLFPALPLGEDRRHLAWLRESLVSFQSFVTALASHAERPIDFEPRPRAFAFYRTAVPTYPSAYCIDGVIGYNLDGPLHTAQREVLETMFHELFHLNDQRHHEWARRALGPVFDAIIARCDDGHGCFETYAPHDTIVPDGTFYGFDRRTRDVREYGAELALRYFLEHEAILAGAQPLAPFKCRARENQRAWNLFAREFFGGADLTPACGTPS